MEQGPPFNHLYIRLLGAPSWSLGGDPVRHPLSRKDAALFAVLALEGPQPRERLAGLVWPDVASARASSNLRQRLFRLRQTTQHALIDSGELLRPAPGLCFDIQGLDRAAAGDAVQPAVDPGDELLGAMDFADDGDLLCNWVRQARALWRTRRIDLLTGLAARHEAAGELAAALVGVERLLAIDPLLEHAWRRLMRLHHLRGDRAAAVASFERCEQVLKDELGLRPSAETVELLAGIERAQPAPARPPLPMALVRPERRVGRALERQQMLAAWQAGRPFLLVGDAGLGKTRLLVDLAAEQPQTLLETALPGDEHVPFATLARVLRRAMTRDGIDLGAPLRADLARLLPELGPQPNAAAADEATLRRAVDRALAAAQASGLQAVLIDDLHHADAATLATLHHHAGQDGGMRLGFSCRPDPSHRLDLSNHLLTDSVRAVPVPLPPLADGDMHELVADLMARLTSRDASGRQAALADAGLGSALVRHCAGNPFFALETLKVLVIGGAPQDGPLPLAPSINALIEQRLRPLSAASLALARVAALAGADFGPELAARVMDSSILALADAWAELQALQLLRGDGFAHDMVRVAVREGVPKPLRAGLHRRIAAALEALGAPAERAALHHAAAQDWLSAAQAARRAVVAARQVGRRAEELAFSHQAAGWFEQAGQPEAAFDARLDAVQACAATEGLPAAAAWIRRLLADPLLVQPVLPAARRRSARAHIEACLVLGDLGEFEAALRHGEQAIAATSPDDELGRRARASQAMTLAVSGQPEPGLVLLEQALDCARRNGSPTELCSLYNDQAYVLNYASRRAEAVRALERALDLSTELSAHHDELSGLNNLAVQYAVLGRSTEAIAAGQRARTLGQMLGVTLDVRNTEVNLGMFLAGEGRFREALELLQSVHAHALAHAPDSALQHCAEEFLAETWCLLGRPDRARQALGEQPIEQISRVRWAFRLDLLARLAASEATAQPPDDASLGRWRQALAAAEEATPLPTRVRVRLNASLALPADEAWAQCALALDEARGAEYPPGELLAHLRRARLLLRQSDPDAAAAALAPALALHAAGIRHVFVSPAELHGVTWQVSTAQAARGDRAAAARAEAALADGRAWLADCLAGDQLPAEALQSFPRQPDFHAIFSGAAA